MEMRRGCMNQSVGKRALPLLDRQVRSPSRPSPLLVFRRQESAESCIQTKQNRDRHSHASAANKNTADLSGSLFTAVWWMIARRELTSLPDCLSLPSSNMMQFYTTCWHRHNHPRQQPIHPSFPYSFLDKTRSPPFIHSWPSSIEMQVQWLALICAMITIAQAQVAPQSTCMLFGCIIVFTLT